MWRLVGCHNVGRQVDKSRFIAWTIIYWQFYYRNNINFMHFITTALYAYMHGHHELRPVYVNKATYASIIWISAIDYIFQVVLFKLFEDSTEFII